jgi:ribonuclease P protein component
MIARSHRFHGYNSLNLVYRRGATVRDYHMSLRYLRNSRRSTYRVAVIVSRKVHKSAVQRNRVRRRIYEIIRLHGAAITEPYDLVFTVFSDQLEELPSDQLARIVLGLCRKAGVLGAAGPGVHPGHGIVTRERG